MRVQQAARAKLVQLKIDHPVQEGVSGKSLEAILEEYQAIEKYLVDQRDIRWWDCVEDEIHGGDQQRHLLAYALASCPMCNWLTANGTVPEAY